MTPQKFGNLLLVDISQTVFHDDDHDSTPLPPPPPPPSPTGGPSTDSDPDTPPIVLPAVLSQPSTDLDRLRHKCGSELESPPASTLSPATAWATIPTKEKVSSVSCHISMSRTQNGCYGDAVPVQPLIQCQDENVITACLDEALENKRAPAIVMRPTKAIINVNTWRAQAEPTCIPASHGITCGTCNLKRTIECIATGRRDTDSDKENVSLDCHGSFTPAIQVVTGKCICREKTGTEWQTVLDVIKYGEEQRSRQENVAAILMEKQY
ncbi:hypothetical protein CY34DRAFT_109299 [Suillus luteus UH-Slu-Lm8-n1]|uniref:Uncharacterized protein n=1 Tax=Suillus luteus UH-Slu-Lm8-n1 TaxID=930992 RepID=A0A0D0A622_9AGAM|nr:hypothetical protein CY34DRAFT_109299 [Suillus luteus UH-Slu-Lm8-n1]